MYEFLKEWIQNISFYFILVTLILQMLPEKSFRKYIQFITGLILILLLMEPILSFTKFSISFESYEKQLQEFEEEIHAMGIMENK